MEESVCNDGDVEGFTDPELFSVEYCFPIINDEEKAPNPPDVVAEAWRDGSLLNNSY